MAQQPYMQGCHIHWVVSQFGCRSAAGHILVVQHVAEMTLSAASDVSLWPWFGLLTDVLVLQHRHRQLACGSGGSQIWGCEYCGPIGPTSGLQP
jgi:hypothetical protein